MELTFELKKLIDGMTYEEMQAFWKKEVTDKGISPMLKGESGDYFVSTMYAKSRLIPKEKMQ